MGEKGHPIVPTGRRSFVEFIHEIQIFHWNEICYLRNTDYWKRRAVGEERNESCCSQYRPFVGNNEATGPEVRALHRLIISKGYTSIDMG